MRKFPIPPVPDDGWSFIGCSEVDRRRATHAASRHRAQRVGLWPEPIKLINRRVYGTHEVEALFAAVVAGATDSEMRDLSRRIVEARQSAVETAA